MCFMYSCYVISSFLITILRRYYFILLTSGWVRRRAKAVSVEIINCIFLEQIYEQIYSARKTLCWLDNSTLPIDFSEVFCVLRFPAELYWSSYLHHCSLVFGLSLADTDWLYPQNFSSTDSSEFRLGDSVYHSSWRNFLLNSFSSKHGIL